MVRLFTDFDGTITTGDVGDALFGCFGGAEALHAVAGYRDGKLSAVGCFEAECRACGAVGVTELGGFLDSARIDDTFPEFVAWCRRREFPLMILSDGMDAYIDGILRRHGLSDVEFRANRMEIRPAPAADTVSFVPSFPYTDEVCDRCASCKRNHMLTMSADDDIIVYIGEGYSDRCPAQYADVVFAKDDLLGWCRANSIPCHEYASFREISARIDRMAPPAVPGGRATAGPAAGFGRRRRAAIARRDIYLGG
ncbi:MAG TPA: MtnX-like HAD-IB family phosphatase [Bacteroidota bacterium]|nr:MtnX-like HAD-IB family phosphatase [Bacteroidota bacterium]